MVNESLKKLSLFKINSWEGDEKDGDRVLAHGRKKLISWSNRASSVCAGVLKFLLKILK